MAIVLQAILGLVASICLLGGFNLLNKGAMAFLPKGHAPAVALDNLFRFTSGIYCGMGFLLAWVVATIGEHTTLIYFLGIVVAFAGLGRAWSIAKMGSPGTYYKAMMWLEIGLGAAVLLAQWLRD